MSDRATIADRPACKSCGPGLSITEEEIAKAFRGLAVRKVKLADPSGYDRRLKICRACPDLLAGTTCRHCGCLVEVKAKIRAASCPSPGGSRWV